MNMLGRGGPGQAGPGADAPVNDTSERIHISSLALLKMLKHGRAGVPMEVMGLMLGEFVDDYTVRVVDVFAMPQSGTSVSVESVDPVFQTKMLEFLQQTNRPEMVVGWYHSHPGFGCWLSGTDVNTQQSFEQLNQRAVAVVVDPIQSVKGKVVLDAFRLINPQLMMMGQEPRQTTSNIGHLSKPSIQALIHGLNRHYYSIAAAYRKNDLELKMLMNLRKKKLCRFLYTISLYHFHWNLWVISLWIRCGSLSPMTSLHCWMWLDCVRCVDMIFEHRFISFHGGIYSLKFAVLLLMISWMHGLTVNDYDKQQKECEEQMESFLNLAKKLNQRLKDESELTEEQNKVAHVGKIDPRKRLNMKIDETLKSNIVQNLGAMVNAQVF